MRNIKITITTVGGSTIEIDANENSTIQELKRGYVKILPNDINKEEVLKDEHNFQFAMGTEIPDDNRKLNEVFKGDELKGEITITAITRPLSIAKCLREIYDINPWHYNEERLAKLKPILKALINRKGEKTMFASEDRDIVLAAVRKNGFALAYAS